VGGDYFGENVSPDFEADVKITEQFVHALSHVKDSGLFRHMYNKYVLM
jgi:hypothetical protein